MGVAEREPSATVGVVWRCCLEGVLGLDMYSMRGPLEKAGLRPRAESLVELLEMKIMIARTPGLSNVAH